MPHTLLPNIQHLQPNFLRLSDDNAMAAVASPKFQYAVWTLTASGEAIAASFYDELQEALDEYNAREAALTGGAL